MTMMIETTTTYWAIKRNRGGAYAVAHKGQMLNKKK